MSAVLAPGQPRLAHVRAVLVLGQPGLLNGGTRLAPSRVLGIRLSHFRRLLGYWGRLVLGIVGLEFGQKRAQANELAKARMLLAAINSVDL